MSRILFCQDPLSRRQVDADYAAEAAAATQGYGLVNYEALANGDAALAVQNVAAGNGNDLAIYRGWMVTLAQYSQLYAALLERGLRLVNSPVQYHAGHYLPGYYTAIAGVCPESIWFEFDSGESNKSKLDQILNQVESNFGDDPIIVRDYAKSEKHYWHEACFVPDASNRGQLASVVNRFMELRGPDLAGGLVFREYVPLAAAVTTETHLPAGQEYRLWFIDGQLLHSGAYWPGQVNGKTSLSTAFPEAAQIAARIGSRFLTLDVALTQAGHWTVIEAGDGQVSGLQGADPAHFYQQLYQLLGA